MTSPSSRCPVAPRNGHTLVVGIGARISGCAKQKEVSLEDQVDHAKQEIADVYDGPVAYRVISTKGKGERLDRPELEQIETELRKREIDIFVFEDLGRLVRGTEAVRLLGIAVDHGTRVICPNDCIDTADATWEEDAISACRDHVGHNAHAAKRIKQKTMNRFKKFGGSIARPIYGYIVAPGGKTYGDWQKDPKATAWIVEGARLLQLTLNGSVVADRFNDQGVPVGPYSRTKKQWTGTKVLKFYRNPLLKGQPQRGIRHSVKHHETGRRMSVKNPNGPEVWHCPHLAHLDPVDFDALNALLNERNARFKRKPVNGSDPRLRVAKKRTRFPGQHSRCWYCGRNQVWGGNGITSNLMCSGSREWLCWNSIGFAGSLAVEGLGQAITTELYGLDGFDDQFRALIQRAQHDSGGNLSARWEQIRRDSESLANRKENVKAVISELGLQPLTGELLAEVSIEETRLALARQELERLQNRALVLPASITDLRAMFEESQRRLMVDSPEFGELMRNLAPDFDVYLVRLCDGGHLLPRARVRLALDGIIPDSRYAAELTPMLTRVVTIDLFKPPQRERIREQAVSLAAEGLGPKAIAQKIQERPTDTAVQNALALQRRMDELGLKSPYVTLLQPPEDYGMLRRHKNAKYHFTLLDGYQPPLL